MDRGTIEQIAREYVGRLVRDPNVRRDHREAKTRAAFLVHVNRTVASGEALTLDDLPYFQRYVAKTDDKEMRRLDDAFMKIRSAEGNGNTSNGPGDDDGDGDGDGHGDGHGHGGGGHH